MMKACPACGQPVDAQTSVCGHCGHYFSPEEDTGTSAWQGSSVMNTTSPPTAPMGSTGGPPPRSGAGIRVMVIAMTLIITGGTLAIFLLVGREVSDQFDNVPDIGDIGVNFNDGGGTARDFAGKKGTFKGAAAVVAAMNKNGARCKRFTMTVKTSTIQSGTCFAGAEPWTIQVFYDELSFNSVVSSYESNKSLHVAFGGNWTVLTQSPRSARTVAKALGGKTS